jgi:acyl carrier protein
MNAENTSKLHDIFRAVFQLPAHADVTQLEQTETAQWDSLAHVSLVGALESEFDVSIDAGDQLSMTSYAQTQQLLEEKGL